VLEETVGRVIADSETAPVVRRRAFASRLQPGLAPGPGRGQIAASIERLVERSARRPWIRAPCLEAGEAQMGKPLNDGQRQAVATICGSGRGAEIVAGVAGSGKSTGGRGLWGRPAAR
jgi:hypothetical protein